MRIKRLTLVNFKNHESREFLFSKRINCFTGCNGVGKTNVLDALYYLSFSKSFLNPTDNQNIRNDEEFFTIRGVYDIDEMEENIVLNFNKTKGKSLKRNDKEYEKISDHIGLIPLVIINPQDIKLIFDGSAERRKFIDSAVSQKDTKFLTALQNYNRALIQRNKYLKSANSIFDPSLMLMWNMHLISNGNIIFQGRKKFIEKFTIEFQKYYSLISDQKEIPELKYYSQLLTSDLEELLETSLEKDRALQYTSCGIHKDDLLFEIGELPLKNAGSQGQQKTYLAALKLAQFSYLKQSGKTPILLLDDILDKLDSQRVKRIVNLILEENNFEQIFITHTSSSDMKELFLGHEDDFEVFEI
ncbi:MAG: DNA replication and repair protein RecF [Bacteroidales bacterium]|nr:DNA replication and repair protein RecF [Bacteroidales bacterium]